MQTIQELMIKNPLTIRDDATVQDAINMFSQNRVGALPVVDANDRLVAFLSDGDVIEFLSKRTKSPLQHIFAAPGRQEATVSDEEIIKEACTASVLFCATKKVQYAYPEDNMAKVASRMVDNLLKFMPIVDRDSKKLVGMLSRRDLTLSFFDSIVENK